MHLHIVFRFEHFYYFFRGHSFVDYFLGARGCR
jgi:hypothetical protein